jgi:hypothetical protein
MNKIRFLILSLSIMAFLIVNGATAFSQQYQSSPTDMVLEVTYLSGRPPAFQSVPKQDAKLIGSWYALFGNVPSWQPSAGFLPVKAVNVLSRQEGDSVKVVVSVFVGAEHFEKFEKEEPVGTYLIHENEKIRADKLTQFGVEPFEIKLAKVFPVSSNLPQIVNKTESIVVTNVELNDSTLLCYKLLTRNLSGKNVVALGIEVFVNNRRRLSSIRQGQEGQALIAANSDSVIKVLGANNAHPTTDGYAPEAPLNQEIHINTVLFEDGSYEGDAVTAATFRGFMIGRKAQFGKVIPLLQDALKESEMDGTRALENFKTRLASISVEVNPMDLERLQQEFPGLDGKAKADLKISLEVALNGVKFDLTKSLQEFEKSSSQPPDINAFRVWLGKTIESYEKWRSRL